MINSRFFGSIEVLNSCISPKTFISPLSAFIIASYNKVEKPKSETEVSISKVAKESTVATKSGKCDKLIEVLKKKHILLNSEVDYINS